MKLTHANTHANTHARSKNRASALRCMHGQLASSYACEIVHKQLTQLDMYGQLARACVRARAQGRTSQMGGMHTHKMLRVKPGIRLELESNLAEANDNKRADNSYCTPCHSQIISLHFLSILSVFFPNISARLSLCLCDPLHLSIYLSRGVFEPKCLGQQVKICVPTSLVSSQFKA